MTSLLTCCKCQQRTLAVEHDGATVLSAWCENDACGYWNEDMITYATTGELCDLHRDLAEHIMTSRVET